MSVLCKAEVMYMCMSKNRSNPAVDWSWEPMEWLSCRRSSACSNSSWLSKWTNHSNDRCSRFIQKKSTFFKLNSKSDILSPLLHDKSHRGQRVLVDKNLRDKKKQKFSVLSWLHLKRISGQIAATLRATWELLFWPTWPPAVDWPLLLDERSLKATAIDSQNIYLKAFLYAPW